MVSVDKKGNSDRRADEDACRYSALTETQMEKVDLYISGMLQN